MKKLSLTTAFVACLFFNLVSQTTGPLQILQPYLLKDTVQLGDTLEYNIIITNSSGTTFSGPVEVRRKNQLTGIDDVLFTEPALTLISGDTMSFPHSEIVYSSKFGGGVNVLIVWPSSPIISVSDSTEDSVYVDCQPDSAAACAVHREGDLDENVMDIGQNPIKDWAEFIQNGQDKTLPYEVMVLDPSGREAIRYPFEEWSVKVKSLSQGMYYVIFRFRDGRSESFKILKFH